MTPESFLNLLSTIAILVLLMVTGFICRKLNVIDGVASKKLSSLIISIGLPMMVIAALIAKPFSWELAKEGLSFLLLGFLLHPLMALLALPFSKCYKDIDERKINLFATIFTNCGFIGFPILEAVFPGKGAFNGAFFMMGFHVYVWTLGIWILSRGRDDIKLTPKKALINLGTVPCVIAFILYFLKIFVPTPSFLIDYTNQISNLCLPISVLVTGALVATQKPKDMLTNVKLYLFNFVKLIFVPLAVCIIVKIVTLGMENSYIYILFSTVISALPSAATITMLGELHDIKPAYAAQTVGSTSILSVATLPLMCFVADFIAKL